MRTKRASLEVVTLVVLLLAGPWPTNGLRCVHAQGLTMDQIRSNLLSNPPGFGDPAVREASLLAFDALLLPYAKPETLQFYKDQVGKVAYEIQADAPAGAYVWMMYNHGYLIKTPGAVLAFDLLSSPPGTGFVMPDDIVKRIDVLFVSHNHGDHYDSALAMRVIRNNGLVVGPSEMFGTGRGYVGMAAGQSRPIKNLQVAAHYGEHSVPVRMFEVTCPNGMKFLHTGDNQASWNLPTIKGCLLLLNAWVNESGSSSAAIGMRHSLQRVEPFLMIPGHIQELGHAYTPGDPTSRVIYAWAFEVDDVPIAAPMEVMTWGERYTVVLPVHYVAAESAEPASPYTSWATAATNIQEAVDAVTVPGAWVLVTNGIYATGGRPVYGTLTNRLVVDKPVAVQSVNGPQFTMIQGYQVPDTTNGDSAIRCVYLTNGARLSGFTLTNGATRLSGDYSLEQSGGGLWCEDQSAVVSNCVVAGNSAYDSGAGAYRGTLNNCTVTANSGTWFGGGACQSALNNCTVAGNSVTWYGGGVYGGTLNNCIVYFNAAMDGANYYEGDPDASALSYCCTTPEATNGPGNITNAPLFVDYAGGNLRLQSNSPCINGGLNAYAPGLRDLEGNPRIVSGTVDIGAYEFQGPGSVISYAWLHRYGLLTDGSADFTDVDGDGLNNWQEWRCGTNPTNALSALWLLAPESDGTHVRVTWQSVAGVPYFLERSTNLASPFAPLATNIVGQAGTTTHTDTNATSLVPRFYRVGVP